MSWEKNETLKQLVVSDDVLASYTTYERLCFHLVHSHGMPGWVVIRRAQTELEAIHNRAHQSKCGHKHDRPIMIMGYEPKASPNQNDIDFAPGITALDPLSRRSLAAEEQRLDEGR